MLFICSGYPGRETESLHAATFIRQLVSASLKTYSDLAREASCAYQDSPVLPQGCEGLLVNLHVLPSAFHLFGHAHPKICNYRVMAASMYVPHQPGGRLVPQPYPLRRLHVKAAPPGPSPFGGLVAELGPYMTPDPYCGPISHQMHNASAALVPCTPQQGPRQHQHPALLPAPAAQSLSASPSCATGANQSPNPTAYCTCTAGAFYHASGKDTLKCDCVPRPGDRSISMPLSPAAPGYAVHHAHHAHSSCKQRAIGNQMGVCHVQLHGILFPQLLNSIN